MPLDSSDSFAKTVGGTCGHGRAFEAAREEELRSVAEASCPWCYLFVHHSRVETVNERLQEKFPTFIHRSVVYKKHDKRVVKSERPTISGLIFVQGDTDDIRRHLADISPLLHLVNDCSTRRTAVIPDSVMQAFMQVARFNPLRIRFMPHSFGYYAEGHPLVRVTSGPLAGLEGYQIRISRDKCLVTSIGNMTVAIGAVSKETFENVDDYIGMRRAELAAGPADSAAVVFPPVQQEIEKSFFLPATQLDLLAIAGSIDRWLRKAETLLRDGAYRQSAEIVGYVLEAAGSHFHTVWGDARIGDFKDVAAACREADRIWLALIAVADTGLAEALQAGRDAIRFRYPFLPTAQ